MANSEPTTALETLGTYITGAEARDAIHLAVVPIVASEKVYPGQHLTATGNTVGETVGICDPFLPGPVNIGQAFWLVLYPRTITSLRHAWTHPAFPETAPQIAVDPDKEASKAYLEDFASRLFSYYGQHSDDPDSGRNEYPEGEGEYGSRLKVLLEGIEYGGAFGTDIEYGDDLKPSEELYRHYEIYTGNAAPTRPEWFRCAC